MIFLTEKQRTEALDICERIEALNEKMQFHANEALKILDRLSKPPVSAPAHTAELRKPLK